MKLYYSPGACSLAPHIALIEAGTKFTAEKVDLKNKKTETGQDFTSINPKGSVPAIKLDNGELLTETAVLLQYIADQNPSSNLIPEAGTWERYRAMEWLNYISSELHKGMGVLWAANLPEDFKTMVHKELLPKKFKYLDNHFKTHKFLLGGSFTVADAYLFTILNWTGPLKVDVAPYANIKTYRERVSARPAVQKALEEEGLTKKAA